MIVTEYRISQREYVALRANGPRVHIFVFSLDGVNAYLVNQSNFERYQKGLQFAHYGPGSVQSCSKWWALPFTGPCFAILENSGPTPVTVAAELTSLGG